MPMTELPPLDRSVLPDGIRARFVDRVNGLRVHILEPASATVPACCCCTVFPSSPNSWRKIMGPLAAAGYHVVAPDLRGYGRTTGWSANYDDDLRPFRHLNAVRTRSGSSRRSATVRRRRWSGTILAPAWCVLVRPDCGAAARASRIA